MTDHPDHPPCRHDQAELTALVALHRGLSLIVAGLAQYIGARREADRLTQPGAQPEAGAVVPLVPPRR